MSSNTHNAQEEPLDYSTMKERIIAIVREIRPNIVL
jgi:hypothetical protein